MLTVKPQMRQNLANVQDHRHRAKDKARLPQCGVFTCIVGKTVVRVVYSDESGCGSIKKEPLTVVTAIALNVDHQWDDVEARLAVAHMGTPRVLLYQKPAGKHSIRPFLFKGKCLYGALRKQYPGAGEALRSVLEIIALQKVPIFCGAVDRAGLIKTPGEKMKSPLEEYRSAFRSCISRVDSIASGFTGEKLLWIAEESDAERDLAARGGHEAVKLFKGIRFKDGEVTYTGERTSIVDTVYFGKKEYSLMLQLADVCCSTVTNHLLEEFYGWKNTGVGPYYDIIRPHVFGGNERPEFFGHDKVQHSDSHGIGSRSRRR